MRVLEYDAFAMLNDIGVGGRRDTWLRLRSVEKTRAVSLPVFPLSMSGIADVTYARKEGDDRYFFGGFSLDGRHVVSGLVGLGYFQSPRYRTCDAQKNSI